MSKIKIKELSDQMSLEVKDILSKCKELSIIARTQSSSISLDDAKKALQFLKFNHEKFNIDKEKIILWGVSSGAKSVLWLGLSNDMAEPEDAGPEDEEETGTDVAAMAQDQALDAVKEPGLV